MEQTDGLFHNVFDEVAKEYPEIENEHWIVDIGSAKLADTHEDFDVIVMPNLYGDNLSDVATQIAGSANIGEECAMFEAIHGSAALIAGQNIANPSRLLQGAIMMSNHIGQPLIAEKIQNAWLKAIEEGILTFDIYKEGNSRKKVGTSEFSKAVIANLDHQPSLLKAVSYAGRTVLVLPKHKRKTALKKELVGVDVFLHWTGNSPDELSEKVKMLETDQVKLSMITNRGIKVWPEGFSETFCTDHWRCRFEPLEGEILTKQDIIELLFYADSNQLDTIKTENLYTFDGKIGFSLGQGQ